MIIAVVGASQCTPREAEIAEAIGRELARRGAILICGGRGGVMEAACRGAKAGGGQTVGILPGASRYEANPYVDIPIATGLGEARNLIIVRSADAVIAVGGEYGTLSELAFALKLGVPVVGLGTWELSKGGLSVDAILRATSPVEAVEQALALGRSRRNGDAISGSA
ncbi:MAG: TIGR00725 family protein [Anaerolineae bacterium]|nr:TIGR00725 family protein [Anaerolineae bacterium]MDH7474858.1 TIGR00725 family protein [Anaerolineae bacterium]